MFDIASNNIGKGDTGKLYPENDLGTGVVQLLFKSGSKLWSVGWVWVLEYYFSIFFVCVQTMFFFY